MKNLREIIRKIILEDKIAFKQELSGDSDWDEGARDYYDVPYKNIKQIYGQEDRVKRARKRGRKIKQIWAKHVDREFVDSLIYVHWMEPDEILPFLLASEPPNKDELSCSAYINGKIKGGHNMGYFGVIVRGHVTLLGNSMDDMYTGNRNTIDSHLPNMKKSSGIHKGPMSAVMDTYILSKEDFTGPKNQFDENEALLDNWEVIALFVPRMFEAKMKEIRDKYEYETGIYLSVKHPGAYL
mgnify:CR=1 FL=1